MAIMYPSNIESYQYTESERYVYDKLKSDLNDDFTVFYSIRWYTSIEGKKAVSECDFLIFHPSYGYLCMEVKGGVEIQIQDNVWKILDRQDSNEYRVLRRDPFRQAEESMYYFKNYYEKQFASKYAGVYGFVVATPFYNIEGDIGISYPKFLLLDKDSFNDIEEKILHVFRYWRNRLNNILPFGYNQQQKFMAMLNKRVALSAAAGALIEMRTRELNKLERIQDAYIDFVQNYNQIFIIGGAGTGKTWIGIKKAIKDCRNGKKVLIVTPSQLLCEYIERQLEGYDITCITTEILCAQNETYQTIIVDEAQDLDEITASQIRSRLEDKELSTLYVMYDNNQRVHNVNFKDKFQIQYPEFILRENVRNTSQIYNWCVDETNIGIEVKPSLIQGVKPEVSNFREEISAIKKIEEILNTLIRHECVDSNSVTILSNRKFEYSVLRQYNQLAGYNIVTESLDVNNDEILFKTDVEYKGLESDVIIYINHIDGMRDLKREYVAYTRARFYLYVINVI